MSPFRIFDDLEESILDRILDLIDAISADQATRQTIPAARNISRFHLLMYLVLRSILSLSTVGITEGADM